MKSPFPMYPDCFLIKASQVMVGDLVLFRAPGWDYVVTAVEVDDAGHYTHRTTKGTKTCTYHPGELLWVVRHGSQAA